MTSIVRAAIAFVVLSLVATIAIQAQQQAAQQAAAPAGPLAPEKYKNIQVLKEVPAADLDLLMRYFTAATGFQCQTCHVRDQATGEFRYEEDTQRAKATARNMIRLVQTVNASRDQFGVNINCGTCHQGANRPAGLQPAQMMTPDQLAALAARQGGAGPGAAPPPAGGAPAGAAGQPGPGRGAAAGPPIDEVLDKYITALGGRPALEKLQTRVMTGTYVTRANVSIPFTIEEKGSKYRETAQLPAGAQIIVFDGQAGWLVPGAQAARDLEGYPLRLLTRLAEFNRPLTFKDRYQNLQSTTARLTMSPGATPINTNMIQGVPSPGVTERFYFDAGSGLLVRRQITTRAPLNGTMSEIFDYSMYRAVNGVMMPHTIKRNNWAVLDTFTVTDIKVNTPLDDGKFVKPKG